MNENQWTNRQLAEEVANMIAALPAGTAIAINIDMIDEMRDGSCPDLVDGSPQVFGKLSQIFWDHLQHSSNPRQDYEIIREESARLVREINQTAQEWLDQQG